ncbi:rod-binding protein [Orenia marismortui]|uniref:Flagellar protein FlgJ n=1 Tax=Orenia marismortui TaxID=46469 RepID=A0A4R8HG27_9FIRM|nr:rod-binding protein [Orenia marismortui]TDX59186.1 flagellar protein FlgJ [Orenia marismortui]
MKINSDLSLNKLATSQSDLKKSEQKFKDYLSKQVNNKDNSAEDQELKAVSKQLESVFLNMMFKQMRKSVVKSDLLDSGLSREIFEDMYYNKVAESASKRNELGLAKLVYQQLSNKL